MAKISILGSGTVGTVVGRGLEELGNQVKFYDPDERRVQELRDLGLSATDDLDHAVSGTEISFLCVPTPTKNEKIDLSFIKSATESLALSLKNKPAYHVVVVKSTVVPMTTERVIVPLLQKYSGKKAGSDIGICANPEFLTEAHSSWTKNTSFKRDFFSEERVVIGEFDKRSGNAVQRIYEPLQVPIIRTDLRTAEMIKYASNCALASRISYWNEIYYVCQKLGINSDLVARVAAMDKRIGKYGTVHGKAFGGKCLPKDLGAFISFIEELGYEPRFLKAVKEINEKIKRDKGVRE